MCLIPSSLAPPPAFPRQQADEQWWQSKQKGGVFALHFVQLGMWGDGKLRMVQWERGQSFTQMSLHPLTLSSSLCIVCHTGGRYTDGEQGDRTGVGSFLAWLPYASTAVWLQSDKSNTRPMWFMLQHGVSPALLGAQQRVLVNRKQLQGRAVPFSFSPARDSGTYACGQS